jgi:4-alpha-glucanotransferase
MKNYLRSSGVLLPVFSLTGDYGIGDIGAGAYFASFIRRMGFSVWQVLPVTAAGEGNSPYSGESSFAGNYLLIDIEALPERLLPKAEKDALKYKGSRYKVDYEYAKSAKKRLLQSAYSRLEEGDRLALSGFSKKNAFWLEDYALYMAIKDDLGGADFTNWEPGLKYRDKSALEKAAERLSGEIDFYRFGQFVFYSQWEELKTKVSAAGVSLFGDMPIYVAKSSVEVWARPEIFELNEELLPREKAGVPPDYFAKDGQLWGNPVYDWESPETYSFFIERARHNLSLYDELRIDHFRGISEFWSIPEGAVSAKEGRWRKGPGYPLIAELKNKISDLKIVAEDLGIIDLKVRELLKKSGFPGMRVFQFAFDGDKNNVHLPYNYDSNSVAYTATHDNNTTLGWLYELPRETREYVLNYLSIGDAWGIGGGSSPSVRAVIKEVIASVASLAIIPLQDLCGYGSDTRINVPGVAKGNWEYRATNAAYEEIDGNFILELNRRYGRCD